MTGAGKLFYGGQNRKYLPNYAGSFGGFGPFPKKKISPFPGMKLWDWGVFPERDDLMPDYKIAAQGTNRLKPVKRLVAASRFLLLSRPTENSAINSHQGNL